MSEHYFAPQERKHTALSGVALAYNALIDTRVLPAEERCHGVHLDFSAEGEGPGAGVVVLHEECMNREKSKIFGVKTHFFLAF